MHDKKLSEISFVAFDIETSGSYPLESEICELAAVKSINGTIIDRIQILAKTMKPMSDFIIGIHGITNEMVAQEPLISERINEFYNFIKDSICIAHHAPFDMGFISIEFENRKLLPPPQEALCTSLLARKLFPESANHKLQTLVEFFKLEKNQAHRALDDAISCHSVMVKCFDKIGWEKSIEEVYKIQGKKISWQNFYLAEYLKKTAFLNIIEATKKGLRVRALFKYGKGKTDEILKPLGFVRSPDGDYIFAFSEKEKKVRRFYLEKLLESEII